MNVAGHRNADGAADLGENRQAFLQPELLREADDRFRWNPGPLSDSLDSRVRFDEARKFPKTSRALLDERLVKEPFADEHVGDP